MKTKEQLEFKHLAPYLPHSLTCLIDNDDNDCVRMELTSLTTGSSYECADFVSMDTSSADTVNMVHIENIVPVLRPLSDLHKEINGRVPANFLYREYDLTDLTFNGHCENPKYGYEVYSYLIGLHFDVFGLIEQNLAMDINKLNPGGSNQ